MKGQGRPIWILVTLLLALVVGVSMYQLIGRTQSQTTFDDMFQRIDSGSATNSLNSICGDWEGTSYAARLSANELETLRDVSAVKGWLSAEEWEDEENFSECDCAMWLFTQNAISRTKARQYYDPDECHEKANEVAEDEDIA